MTDREVKKWITINGHHVPIYEDGYEDSSKKTTGDFVSAGKDSHDRDVWKNGDYQIVRAPSKSGIVSYYLMKGDHNIANVRTNTTPDEKECFDKLVRYAEKQMSQDDIIKDTNEDSKVATDNALQSKLLNSTLGDTLGEVHSVEDRTAKLQELSNSKEGIINPHWNDDNARKEGYKTNCSICTTATMMQMFGYDVEAGVQPDKGWVDPFSLFKPDLSNSDNYIMAGGADPFELSDYNIKHWTSESLRTKYPDMSSDEITAKANQLASSATKMPRGASAASKAIDDKVQKWGNGAFGELSVTWSNGNSHSLFIFNDNGVVTIYDGQSNKSYKGLFQLECLLKGTKANNTQVIRYDNFVGLKPGAGERMSSVLNRRN